jgi:hypothetical protein
MNKPDQGRRQAPRKFSTIPQTNKLIQTRLSGKNSPFQLGPPKMAESKISEGKNTLYLYQQRPVSNQP